MSDIKVSEMPEASELNDNDLLMIVQNGANKKVKVEKIGIASVNEKINKIGAYSTEEINTGKTWIDGKPIYRKVITVPNLTSTTTTVASTVSVPELNIENIIEMKGIAKLNSNEIIPIPYAISTQNFITCVYTQNGKIAIYAYNLTTVDIKMYLEYTKTTD